VPLSVGGLGFGVGTLAVVFASSEPQVALPFLAWLMAFWAFGYALYRLNGNLFGRVAEEGTVWRTLGSLPRWARIATGVLFTLAVLGVLTSHFGLPSDDVADARLFAGASLVFATLGAGVHYALQLEDEPGPGGTVVRSLPVVAGVVGLGVAVGWFLVLRSVG
jgi:hypothetical protein